MAEEMDKFVLILLSIIGKLDFVKSNKSEGFYLALPIAFIDEQQKDSRNLVKFGNAIQP
jgi:hypothetical protein